LSLELAPPKNEGVLQMAERLIKKEREGNVEVREKIGRLSLLLE